MRKCAIEVSRLKAVMERLQWGVCVCVCGGGWCAGGVGRGRGEERMCVCEREGER